MSKMITKLLLNNDFIDEEDKQEMEKEFKESFAKSENSDNPFIKKMNAFFSHPIGVLMSIFGYAKLGQMLIDIQRKNDRDELEEEFRMKFREQMMSDMLKEE